MKKLENGVPSNDGTPNRDSDELSLEPVNPEKGIHFSGATNMCGSYLAALSINVNDICLEEKVLIQGQGTSELKLVSEPFLVQVKSVSVQKWDEKMEEDVEKDAYDQETSPSPVKLWTRHPG